MLPYRIIQIAFSFILFLLFFSWLMWAWPLWYFFIALIVYISIVAYGSYNIRLNFFAKTLCQGKPTEPKIALTFDDGPSQVHTPAILDVLRKYNAKATFFCIGHKIMANRELLQRIHQEGHTIGNHSYSHSLWFDFYSKKKVVAELQKTNDLILSETGKFPRLFRPPYGVTNPPIARAVSKTGMKTIGWSIRSYDTMKYPAEKVLKKVLPKIKNGSVILLHDDREETPKIVEGILQYASAHKLKCVDICEIFELECYEQNL